MMGKNARRMMLSAVAFAFVAVLGCGADDGAPGDLAGTDTGNALVLNLSAEGGFDPADGDGTIDEAWIGLEDLTLIDCADGSETAYLPGPFTVDLSAETALGTTEAAQGSVCGATMQLHVIPDQQQTTPLAGLSLFASGVSANGTPFEVRGARVTHLSRPLDRIDLVEGTNDLLLQFYPEVWMQGVDVDTAERVDGVAVVDEDHNAVLLDAIHARMMDGMQMGDGDMGMQDMMGESASNGHAMSP